MRVEKILTQGQSLEGPYLWKIHHAHLGNISYGVPYVELIYSCAPPRPPKPPPPPLLPPPNELAPVPRPPLEPPLNDIFVDWRMGLLEFVVVGQKDFGYSTKVKLFRATGLDLAGTSCPHLAQSRFTAFLTINV
jgi:hypothetical protein